MIKEEDIRIKITKEKMKEYYEEKGYFIEKIGQEIIINSKDISSNSHKTITYICDYCGNEFKRTPYSNHRSKDNNIKDSCLKCCRRFRNKETCLLKYNVDNPMKLEQFQIKCENNRKDNCKNFNSDYNHSCLFFYNGIPVSTGQNNLKVFLKDFELNYHLGKYYIDLFKDNICIEYDGKGHDLEVRLNKKTREEFYTKESIKNKYILKNNRLLRIIDRKDKFKNKDNILLFLEDIKNFIGSNEAYKEIIVS